MSSAMRALEKADPRRAAVEEEKLEPTELWLALTSIPRPSKNVPLPAFFPGTDTPVGEVTMWPLTQEEQMAANAEADRFVRTLFKDPQRKEEANIGYVHSFANECAIQVLFRACRDPKNVKAAAFPSPGAMRQALTTDQIGVLWNSYCTVQSELGPIRAHMSKEETEALIIRLAEGGSAFPINGLSWEATHNLVLTMASLIVSFWTDTFSRGLPLDVSTYAAEYLADKHGDHDSPNESEGSVDAPEEALEAGPG